MGILRKGLKKEVYNKYKKIPLRVFLVVPFVLQIFVVVGVTGYLSFRNGQKAVNDVASQLREEITHRIQEKLNDFLATPHLINQLNLDAFELGYINVEDVRGIKVHFEQQIQSFETIDSIFFGSEEDEFIGIQRLNNDVLQLMKAGTSTGGSIQFHNLDDQGKVINLVREVPDFPIRKRPWYTAALKSGKPVWGNIFTYHAYPKMAIPASVPVVDNQGNVVGVIGNNFFLTQISDFLKAIKIGQSGQTFIIERSGLIVASSTLPQPFLIEKGNTKRIQARKSEDTLLRRTAQYLLDYFEDFDKINSPQQLDFYINKERQFLQVLPYYDNRGLDWLIIVVVPESDFMEQINANKNKTIILCLLALVVATWLGSITSRLISKPILDISEASQAIAQGKLEQKLEVKNINELRSLSTSFNQMAAQLKDSFEKLEVRVEERTAELKIAKEEAELANHAKSDFLANMSHELRTPLNAILGFTQLMRRNKSLDKEQQENLAIINRSGEHLLGLINDVLEMSKIEAGRSSLNLSIFDLYSLLDTIEDMFQLRAESKGLQLIFERTPDLPQYIQADDKKLRQVLINLLGNSIKFTQEGGLNLRVDIKQNFNLNKRENKKSNNKVHPVTLIFEVEDTGVGIAPEELDSLFEPFVQTESGRKSKEGTGLGLPISRKFIQLMEGDITVKSQVGKGTVFTFNIKVKIAQESELPIQKPKRQVIALAPDQPKYRILVVDDRLTNRKLLLKLLIPLGFELKEAENGQQALEIWDNWNPHLIWMDMRMPVMDGYEATKQIKAHLKGQATVIIALTASVFEEERSIVLSVGCDDFVRKPFREEVILEKMNQHLGVRYVYEELDPSSLSPSKTTFEPLKPEALTVMPTEWISQLNQAATKLNEQLIITLVEEIPPEYVLLIKGLRDLLDQVRFDVIVSLSEEAMVLS